MIIDCETCQMRDTDHCRDCVVMALCEPQPERGAVVIDAAEERALRELATAGLIPEIRMRPRDRPA